MSDRAETEVNELPDGWEFLPLKEAAQVILGQSPSSESYNEEGNGLAFFQGKAEFGQIYPTVRKWCTAPKKVAEKDDVLVSVRAPVGPTNLAPSKCAIGRGLAALRPLGEGDSRYFLYLIRRFQDDLAALGTGTTFEAISGDTLKNFEVPIAPPKQQKQIVAKIEELFSHIDSGIASLKKAKELLRQYRQSVLKAAVTGELTREWREANKDKLEPAADLLDRILKERRRKWEEQQLQKFKVKGKPPKDNNWKGKYTPPISPDTLNLPELPSTWTWVGVEETTSHIVDCLHSTPKFIESGKYCIDTNSMGEGFISFDKARYVSEETYTERIKRLTPMEGDVLFSREGTIGLTALVPHDIELCLGQRMMMFRAERPILPEYLMWAILSPAFVSQWKPKVTGTTSPHINITDIRAMALPLPPVNEQLEIVNRVQRKIDMHNRLYATIAQLAVMAERNRQSTLSACFKSDTVL